MHHLKDVYLPYLSSYTSNSPALSTNILFSSLSFALAFLFKIIYYAWLDINYLRDIIKSKEI